MSTIAFALRADYEGVYTGGVIVVGYDRTLNVLEALEEGSGQIVVPENDVELVTALDGYIALKRVGAADDADATVDRYEGLTVSQLRAEAKSRGIDKAAGASRDNLLAALRDQDRAVAAGDQATADNATAGSTGQEG